MPQYQYLCSECNTRATLTFPIADKPRTVPCPECDHPMDQQFTTAIAFKGSGWTAKGST